MRINQQFAVAALFTGVLAFMAADVATAQRTGEGRRGGGMQGGANMEEMFNRLDTNGDGSISLEEFTSMRRSRAGGGSSEASSSERERQDPQTQMLNRLHTQMGATDEDWTKLEPQIKKVLDLRSTGMGGFAAMRTRSRDDAAGTSEISKLRTAIADENTSDDTFKELLSDLRKSREKEQTQLESARKELLKLVSPRQEAVLVAWNVLD